MAERKYDQEVHAFIAEHVKGRTVKELTALVNDTYGLGLTECAIASYKKRYKLRSETPRGRKKGVGTKKYPEEVRGYIMQHYKGTGYRKMAEELNEKFGKQYRPEQIKGYYANHKLNSGLDGRFVKGMEPKNKGAKGVRYPGSEKGWYRKRNLPPNTKPIGYERETKSGYIEVKVKMRPSRPDKNDNFVAKQRLIWEEEHGKLPDGQVVIFKDGNKRNFAIENLEAVTLAENQYMNARNLRFNDAEMTQAGVTIARIKSAIDKMEKNQ